ncbi:hypothetical protein FA95DRAFT_1311561 [Auriscalpium vulgare]|uniref:Uncharacterized protein n=1 Tax=Auriscalpium vulgare TaxID=40419 RepID=A0ACB8RSA5_9AGAM|nr:hypothetical protein FA95DRAFT_1311561 [Auriscalpium vulgare]
MNPRRRQANPVCLRMHALQEVSGAPPAQRGGLGSPSRPSLILRGRLANVRPPGPRVRSSKSLFWRSATTMSCTRSSQSFSTTAACATPTSSSRTWRLSRVRTAALSPRSRVMGSSSSACSTSAGRSHCAAGRRALWSSSRSSLRRSSTQEGVRMRDSISGAACASCKAF